MGKSVIAALLGVVIGLGSYSLEQPAPIPHYLAFPQRALFDRLGIRTAVLETDAAGNFLAQGYDFMSARDWARLGNLYLQNGMYAGQRVLPESYVRFVRTVAPEWQEDERPIYGGFWINGPGQFPVPKDSYYMSGAGQQMTMIVPTHDLVVVRLGHDEGKSRRARDWRRRLLDNAARYTSPGVLPAVTCVRPARQR